MPWKNEQLEYCRVLRTVKASFELHFYLLRQLPKPNDSSDYRDRLIYLSCNNCLTVSRFQNKF